MPNRTAYNEDHELFRDSVRKFFERELLPHAERWEAQGTVDRSFWLAAGAAGLLCPTVPEEYGGLGLDFRFNAIVDEEIANAGVVVSLALQSDIIADYFISYGSEALKRQWLPKMVSGEAVAAIAMT